MNSVVLAHVSDLHLPFAPRLTWRQHFSKRQFSVWAWRRRRAVQSPAVLEALSGELRQARPDHIAVTGDITNFSLPDEFVRAAAWLAQLAPPERLSLVPGNHDALVPMPAKEGLARWSAYLPAEAGWPYVHRCGSLALIGLNSALPTAPLLARGRLGASQLERLERVLGETRAAGLLRIVLLHHPVAAGAVGWRKALADHAGLRAVLRRAGAELVLHGHAREGRLDALAGSGDQDGCIPCLCVPSSSALPNPRDAAARWHWLRIEHGRDGPQAEVRVRQWSPVAGAFADAAHYRLQLPRCRRQAGL